MRIIYIVFTCFIIGSISCNNTNSSTGTNGTDSTKTKPIANALPIQSKLNETGTHTLMSVITKYYELKNALVATKGDNANAAAAQLGIISDSLKSFLHNNYSIDDTVTIYDKLHAFIDTISTQSKIIAALKDETCEKQRLAFGILSSAMYGLLKNVDLKNAHVYQEYCPMAFNEKGAHWLSDDSDIKNPYFGKKMLECGEVTDIIK